MLCYAMLCYAMLGKLDDDDRAAIEALPADACTGKDDWYECCGGSQKSIPKCS